MARRAEESAAFAAPYAGRGSSRRTGPHTRPRCETVDAAVAELAGARVQSLEDVTAGPGVQNKHLRATTAEGRFFVKVNSSIAAEVFRAEAESLGELRNRSELRVPRPLRHGSLPGGGGFLVLEWIDLTPFGSAIPEVQRSLGRSLATMHRDARSSQCGFPVDTWLASTRLSNAPLTHFGTFFVERRLVPLLDAARRRFGGGEYGTSNETASAFSERNADRLLRAVSRRLDDVDSRPSLLHGDLWMGNTGADRDRRPVVFDPALWYGHDEFDLAVNTMFGQFGAQFYDGYYSVLPQRAGAEERGQIYRLYHYLNHLTLFGPGQAFRGTVGDPGGYYERCAGLIHTLTRDQS